MLIHCQSTNVLSGCVRDAETGEVLSGVSIETSSGEYKITNAYGYFSILNCIDIDNIKFSHLGYSDLIERNLENVKDLDIRLTPIIHTLKDVTVTSSQQHMSRVLALGKISLNTTQLKMRPALMGEQDVFKYFQMLPGINAGKEGTSGLNIRGGSHDQTLILLDDVPIYNSAHAFGFVSIFNGSYIKTADLYKGYVPEQYGSRLSGVADMQMREGNRKEHHQTLQFGTLTSNVLFEGPLKKNKGAYLIGGRYFIPSILINIFENSQKSRSITIPKLGFYDITAKLSYDISKKNTLYGSFYMGNDNMGSVSYDSEAIDDQGDRLKMKGENGLKWGNMIGSLRLSSRLSSNLFLSNTLYYSHLENNKTTKYSTNVGDYQNGITTSSLDEIGLKTNAEHNININHKLFYGVHVSHQFFSPQNVVMIRDNVETKNTYGNPELFSVSGYMKDEWRFGNWQANIGMRYSFYSRDDLNYHSFEPRLSLSYYIAKSALWLSYTKQTQPLFSMSQIFLSFPLDYWLPYTDTKKIPQSRQISFGGKHHFSNNFMIQAEVYYKKTENISSVYNAQDFLNKQGGAYYGDGFAYGGEILSQYSYKSFRTMASYTYSRSRLKMNQQKFNFIYDTPHDLNLFMALDTYRKSEIVHTLSANMNFKSGLPYYISKEKYPLVPGIPSIGDEITNYPLFVNDRLPNYFRLDLNYAMEKKTKRGKRIWQFSLLNTTGHKNPYLIYYDNNKFKAFQIIPVFPSFSYTREF